MTKKVKISFLILIWGIVVLQLFINLKNPQTLKNNALLNNLHAENEEKVITAFSEGELKTKQDFINFEYTLKEEGNLENDNVLRQDFINQLFEEMKAVPVKTMDTEDFHTVYGYRESEESYYVLNGERINIQVVFSYSEFDDITYIKVGCPIVNSCY